MCPEIVGDPVHPDSMKAGIAGKDLRDSSRSRVFPEYCPDIFSYVFKKFHL
jgi:hypothetical protein